MCEICRYGDIDKVTGNAKKWKNRQVFITTSQNACLLFLIHPLNQFSKINSDENLMQRFPKCSWYQFCQKKTKLVFRSFPKSTMSILFKIIKVDAVFSKQKRFFPTLSFFVKWSWVYVMSYRIPMSNIIQWSLLFQSSEKYEESRDTRACQSFKSKMFDASWIWTLEDTCAIDISKASRPMPPNNPT